MVPFFMPAIHKEILGAVLMALLFALLGNPVYAAEAALVFDQEAYFLKKEEDFEIKMKEGPSGASPSAGFPSMVIGAAGSALTV